MGIGVLGPLEIDGDATGLGHRERIVLEALVVHHGRTASPDELAEAVWGARIPATWSKNLQGCISRIRRALGQDSVETTPQGYRLALPRETVDVGQFERLLTQAEEQHRARDWHRVVYTSEKALGLWRGRPLAELEDWHPGVSEAERLVELRLAAEEVHLEAMLQSGDHHDAVATARALVDDAPSRERRWTLLALAQYRAGDQAGALGTLRRLRQQLAEELGADPGRAAVELQQAILRQDPSLVVPSSGPVDDACPYLGLRSYGEADEDSFFGRSDAVARCLEVLADRGVLAVVGPSGIGKSSVVRAGVAARLRRRGDDVRVVVPGRHPMAALEDAWPDRSGDVVLVVDQAEDLYAACEDAAERHEFVAAVVEHSRHARVVLALRADRTGDLQADPDLARLVERGLFLLGGLSEEGIRAAIEEPARQAGLVVEQGLVDLLVREVENEPGALPMLSHVLRETWLRREGRTITVAGYRASGGIRGAVAQSAEDLFSQVPREEQPLLRDLMLRLVLPGVAGDPVAARLPRRLVVAEPAYARLVDLLVAARLVTSDDGVVQIAHESLTWGWPRLREWLAEDVDGRRTLHHLVTAADAWNDLGRPESELYRGNRLGSALAWREATAPELTAVERDFLDAGARAQQAQERRSREQLAVQARMIRRLRTSLVGAAVLLVLALVAGTVAVVQRSRAEDAADAAAQAERRAVATRAATQALVTDDIPKALLLAVGATRLDPSDSTLGQLQQVLAAYPSLVGVGYGGPSAFGRLAVSPDGRTVAARTRDGAVSLYDADTLERAATRQVGPVVAEFGGAPVAFRPDGAEVAVGASPTDGRPVQLLDPRTLSPLPDQLDGFPRRVSRANGIDYSADGSRIAASVDLPGRSSEKAASGVDAVAQVSVLLVWDLERPSRPVARFRLPNIQGVQLSPDGRTVYVGSPYAAYDVETGRRLVRAPGIYSFVFFELDPAGRRLVMLPYGEGGNDLLVVDARTGEVTERLQGLRGTNPWTVAWSPDGSRVAGTAADGSVVVWDADTGQVEQSISNQDGDTLGLAFSPDGSTLYTAGANRELDVWDLDGYRSFLKRRHVEETAPASGTIEPSPDGSAIAAVAGGFEDSHHEVTVLDVDSGKASSPAKFGDTVAYGAVGWSPDGDRLVTGFGSGVVRVLDPATGRPLMRGDTGGGLVTESVYGGDGSTIVAGTKSGAVRVLDAATLRVLRAVAFDEPVLHVAVQGDSAFVLLGGPSRRWFEDYAATSWALVDTRTGAVLRRGELDIDGAEVSAFSPDARHALVAGRQSQMVVVDTRTGQVVFGPTDRERGTIVWATYDADGSRFLTGSDQGTVRIWDADTVTPLGSVVLPEGSAFASFRPDGTVVATSLAGPVYLWDPSLGSTVDFACRVVGRTLSQNDWVEAFGDQPYADVCPGASELGSATTK